MRDKTNLGFSNFADAAFSGWRSYKPMAVQRIPPERPFKEANLVILTPPALCATV